MTAVQELAQFACRARFDDLSPAAREALRVRILDSLGCAFGALDGEPIRALRGYLEELRGRPAATVIGGEPDAVDRAALLNGALVRYLDYNDSYLAAGETCHPSDNLGAVLAAAEHEDRTGADLMTALAVAYQVQCRLSDVAPVRAKGFDHTTQGSYAAAAGVSKALGLDAGHTANAMAIAGTAFNALRVTRTGRLSHWKGLAYPNTAFCATHAAFLARHGITGPAEVLEGTTGFMDSIAGRFELDWAGEDLERVTRTIVKKYNAEIHSQSALEAVLELRGEHDLDPAAVDTVELEVFDVAYHIIGGGEEGAKVDVSTKEEADHSLPYMVAVALLDGWVGPEQYEAERIAADDVQRLLRRVRVRPADDLSSRFPDAMPVRVTVRLDGGRTVDGERDGYEGFHTEPMTWDGALAKYLRLAGGLVDAGLVQDVASAVAELETIRVRDLTALLGRIGKERTA